MRKFAFLAAVAMMVFALSVDARPRRGSSGGGYQQQQPGVTYIYLDESDDEPQETAQSEEEIGQRVTYKGQPYYMVPAATMQKLIQQARAARTAPTPLPVKKSQPETTEPTPIPRPTPQPQSDVQELTTSGILRVILPTKETKLAINGRVSKLTGTERTYVLTTGEDPKTYTLTITWLVNEETQTQTRRVTVQPSQTSTVNFTIPQPQPKTEQP